MPHLHAKYKTIIKHNNNKTLFSFIWMRGLTLMLTTQ